MKKKQLGSQGLEVGQMGLGCMGMSEFYGQIDEVEATKTIHRALELGVTLFDTADVYGYDEEGMGANERLVGKALQGVRENITIATKFGAQRNEVKFLGYNGSPQYVKEACEASLKRLGTDYIDLYYLHRVDPNTPIEETVGAMARLVEEGKIRYVGLSEVTSEQLRIAHAVHPISAVQTEYSLWSREPELDVLQTCRELTIGFVPYSPLGRGFLTGHLTSRDQLTQEDWRYHNPRFSEEAFAANQKIVEGIKALALEKECTPAQLALAWVLAQGEGMVPIPGTKRVHYVEQNVAALDVSLTTEDIAYLATLAPIGGTTGNRY
ncbi:aldo/keto reductase [Metabacillus iocasae]|uniref:Aryl-alcohol dehydrogenase-like predicted oxidoreductase n=1 Tax=Priestia iocasae TaxID=2291674 RepID=A0ABS2QTJ2_9BACI|nr:aldo/keto reductase [Metabacillus iocasae]MBM7702267.1 aryl-alcohol dehydrogenase-like predicted oxidoreductase [Metabacillus iocasae]